MSTHKHQFFLSYMFWHSLWLIMQPPPPSTWCYHFSCRPSINSGATPITFQAGGRQHNRLRCCQNLMSFCYFLLHLNLTNTIQNLDCSLQVVRKWAEWCTENLNKVTLVSLTWHQTKVCNLLCLENSNSSYYGTQLGTFLTQANCMFPVYNGATAELNTDW